MRIFIIGVSVLLCAISGIITYRALLIPAENTRLSIDPGPRESESISREAAAVNDEPVTGEPSPSDQSVIVLGVLGNDTFLSEQVLIDEDLTSTIIKLVPEIHAYPGHRVIVEGHIDSVSGRMYASGQYRERMDLSYLRAKAAANVLVEQGISSGRISVIGYGDTRPIASNDTEEGRTRNRRIEIKLVPEQKES